MRLVRVIVTPLAAALAAASAFASPDPPHDPATLPQVCMECHTGHGAAGYGLTKVEGNSNLCLSCHQSKGVTGIAVPWVSAIQAVPGKFGTSHRWDAAAVNVTCGADVPASATLSARLDGGKIMCSTCHDQHKSLQRGGGQHISYVRKLADGGGSGTVAASAQAAANPKGYLLDFVVAGAVGAAQFRLSNDAGTSWFGWSGSNWVAYDGSNGRLTAASVTLNDGANVAASFSGSFAAGDRFGFAVSYGLLRLDNASSALCLQCHASRAQTEASSGADGVRIFSHPVGVALARSYDRTGAVRDANGAVQGSGGADAVLTNDLRFDADGKVHCLSCHAPHKADSNSLTED